MEFEPIAIVGRGCVLPQALSPEELWRLVVDGQDALTPPPPGYWNHATLGALTHPAAPPLPHLLSNRGGFVHGFEDRFDAEGFRLPAETILTLDPLFQWLLYAGREALRSAGHDTRTTSLRLGVIAGNLSYPTRAMVDFAERVWWKRESGDPRNRFSSGLPVHILSNALGLGAGGFALDAACASSLYAIKLACDWLHDRRADLMLAGGVNAADGFIIHGGFSVLQAISPTGSSRPFHRHADGLVPAEGAALVALKRLEDADAAGDKVFGVIRGIGLSNDGRGQGFLVPSETAQARAMHQAYAMSGLSPADVSLVECHATGTLVGDAAEVRSMNQVFNGVKELPIGSLKSNLGHLITAAGAAGLLKVLAAMESGVRPPTRNTDAPIDALAGTPFRLLHEAEPWRCNGPLRAGLSSFGFGGNNAHLIVEQWSSESRRHSAARPTLRPEGVAIIGIGMIVGECKGLEKFAETLLAGRSFLKPRPDNTPAAQAEAIELDLSRLRFPPNDLKHALPQQLLVLEAAQQLSSGIAKLPAERTGVFIGMQCDAEGARIAARCRLPQKLLEWRGVSASEVGQSGDAWLAEAYAGVSPPLTPAGVIGAMPNIVANRLHSGFDLKGPGFAVSSEELSGMIALELGVRALLCGELDAALVGGVDLSCEPVHEAAAAALFAETHQSPADAAVIMILKRLEDARRDGDTIYAVVPTQPPEDYGVRFGSDAGAANLLPVFGHAHAASGLLHTAAAALACYHRALPFPNQQAMPWLPEQGQRTAAVSVKAFSGPVCQTWLQPAHGVRPSSAFPVPRLRVYTADTRDGLLRALNQDEPGGDGALRLAIVGRDAAAFQRQREQAMAALRTHREAPRPLCELAEGVYLGEIPMAGDLAFVFTGPAGVYPQMGRDLLLALPELADGLGERFGRLRRGAGWIFAREAETEQTPLNKLWGSSFLSQIHAEFTRNCLGLVPQAAIGFSSGESNALFALGAWKDMDTMHEEIDTLGVFSHELGGEFAAVRRSWQASHKIDWGSWRVFAPVAEVRQALAGESRVHLTIVSTPEDVVIAGDAAGCRRVIETIGSQRAQRLGYNLALHCPEAAVYADTWRDLHHRPTTPPSGVRFYTHATCSYYEPTADRVADMLTRQAMNQLDFPRLIENAWQDGVRVFIEHGPQAGCSGWIQQILGSREHAALALDHYGISSLLQAADTVARLAAIGAPVNYRAFAVRLESKVQHSSTPATRSQTRFPAHWNPVEIPKVPDTRQLMEPAPWLPPVSDEFVGTEEPGAAQRVTDGPGKLFHHMAAHQARVGAMHQEFLRQQTEVQGRFLQLMQETQERFTQTYRRAAGNGNALHENSGVNDPQPPASRAAVPLCKGDTNTLPSLPLTEGESREAAGGHSRRTFPRGPSFTREELKVHASGKISSLFGPAFAQQDRFHVQVRLPEEPLLLVDRVTGIDAEAGSMKLGTLWTETDVHWDSWYLHHGRMPAGIMVEAGQADLMLISWLGVDSLNQGERKYRLLGCDGTYRGGLPKPGDTLCYDIHVDSYARQGEVLLFFFHYDCRINGELRLSVRNGHAGFFTSAELQTSQGVLWNPTDIELAADARVDPPAVPANRSRFSAEHVRAFSEGRVLDCFGPGFERAQTHTQTPRIMAEKMCLLGEVEELTPGGGPWGRGYLRCVTRLSPDDWFFHGHFKNDPCMPGTLMFQACLQAMEFYITAMGYTLERDGWRFEPVTDQTYTLKCRGQAVPSSRQLVYEIFVEEFTADPCPTLYADMLCTVDGLKAFHGRRIGLRLVPDWPLESDRERVEAISRYVEPKPVASVENFDYGYASLLACALGRPSNAFGEMYRVFDGPRRVARLPGPPYHFMSRVCSITGRRGGMQEGSSIEVEYDVPADAWYFEHNGARVMPYCVLMESALQPCGWLASYAGCALTTDRDLCFRNLDGTATVYIDILPSAGTLRIRTTLKSISQAAGNILVAFDVEIFSADRLVAKVDTTFGFFTAMALANQTGIPSLQGQQGLPATANEAPIDLTTQPPKYFSGTLRLPAPMLLMVDRISGCWPHGGKAELGRVRAEKTVDPSAWFFKAHFFQDPVQPGTLGLEAMLQLLQFMMLQKGLGNDIANPRFESVALEQALTWKYRGQVLPENRTIAVDVEIVKIDHDANGVLALAEASLWVDGLPIYQVSGLGMRIVAGKPAHAEFPIDVSAVRTYWRSTLGMDHCSLSEDIYIALLEKYVRRVVIEDPVAFAQIRGRSALFLGNHQVAIETSMLMILASYMSGTEVYALAKTEHQTSWLGELLVRTLSYPGMRPMQNIIYLNREDQKSAAQTLESLKRDLFNHDRSLMVHVEGTRSTTCREPVARISALFLDMAVELELPIVPVRFAGGLPVIPAAHRLEFPIEHGGQDYYFGRPIFPDVLRRTPYAERKQIVLEAINSLGPSPEHEEPNPGDPGFAAAVEARRQTTGASREYATLFTALQRLQQPCAQTRAVLAGATPGSLVSENNEYGKWLESFAQLLYGPSTRAW